MIITRRNKNFLPIGLLTENGIPLKTIRNGITLNGGNAEKPWFVREYKGEAHILYESIPVRSKNKLPELDRLWDYDTVKQSEKENEFKQRRIKEAQLLLEQAKEIGFTEFLYKYEELPDKDKKIDYAKTHSVLSVLLNLTNQKISEGGYKLKELAPIYKELQLEIKNVGYESLKRLLPKIKKNGIKAGILHRGTKNKNAQKLHDWHILIIERLLSDPRKINLKQLYKVFKENCIENKKPIISESTFRYYANKPEVQARIAEPRYGKKYYDNYVKSFLNRKPAENPNDCWIMDGWKIPMKVWNEKKKKEERLVCFVIMDDFSRKILGYAFDWTEDRFLSFHALKHAVECQGLLPGETFSDNGKGLKSKESNDLWKRILHKTGSKHRFSKPNHGQDKARLERLFSTFEQSYLAHFPGFLGQSVTSKQLISTPRSKEIISDFKKQSGVMEKDQLIHLIQRVLQLYNEEHSVSGCELSPNKLYQSKESPNAKQIDKYKFFSLFAELKGEYSVRNGKIKISSGKDVYSRQVYKEYLIEDNVLKDRFYGGAGTKKGSNKVLVMYDKRDDEHIYIHDLNENFICIATLRKETIATPVNQTDESQKELYKQIAHDNSRVKHHQRQRKAVVEKGLNDGGESTVYISPQESIQRKLAKLEPSEEILIYNHQNDIDDSSKELPVIVETTNEYSWEMENIVPSTSIYRDKIKERNRLTPTGQP